jgi:hypothetical protein
MGSYLIRCAREQKSYGNLYKSSCHGNVTSRGPARAFEASILMRPNEKDERRRAPEGRGENSPAFPRWGSNGEYRREAPLGAADAFARGIGNSFVPRGLSTWVARFHPAMNCWAIVGVSRWDAGRVWRAESSNSLVAESELAHGVIFHGANVRLKRSPNPRSASSEHREHGRHNQKPAN